MSAPFRVLVVCTGNVCRSAYGERRLRSALADLAVRTDRLDWAAHVGVASAGIDPLLGEPMDGLMAEVLAERGADPHGHVARGLDAETVASADLVLAASRAHRSEVVRRLPRASRRVFALPEFARLLEDAERSGTLAGAPAELGAVETLRFAVDAAADRRGFAPPPDDPAADDVVDPYRRSRSVHEQAAVQLDDALGRIVGVLERVGTGPALGAASAGGAS